MSVFDNMTDDEIQATQDRLNELCNRHGIEKFSIQGGVGLVGWQKLILAICGVHINYCEQPGRKAYSQEFILDVGARIDIYRDFVRFDNEKFEKDGDLEQIGETLRRDASIYAVADECR